MAYFSNSPEEASFEVTCAGCLHTDDEEAICPINALHHMYHYDQQKPGNEDLKEALAILVNDDGECAMMPFIERIRGKVNQKKKCFQRPLKFGDEEQIKALDVLEL